jgi:hypothetical protein
MTGLTGVGSSRLTWSAGSYLLRDRYQLLLESGTGGVQDVAGNALDGDGPIGTFPSGDGLPGGDWQLPLNVLVGDVNGDGVVNVIDKARVQNCYGAVCGDPKYDPLADFNGDGVINVIDKARVRLHYGEELPAPTLLVQNIGDDDEGRRPTPAPVAATVDAVRVGTPSGGPMAGEASPSTLLASLVEILNPLARLGIWR